MSQSLADVLRAGFGSLHTAHVVVAISQGGPGALRGVADERLTRGVITAMHLTQDLGAGITYDVILIGAHAYAKLPAFFPTSKPWLVVDPRSALGPLRSIAGGLATVRATGSPATLEDYVAAATSIRTIGPRTVDGRLTTGYEAVVVPARLPSRNVFRAKMLAAGLRSLPVEIDVDAAGHAVRFLAVLKSGGGVSELAVTWSAFDHPVRVVAPAADQVGTS